MAILTHWEGEPTAVLERVWAVPLLEVHDRIGSTNDRVRELARDGARPFSVVIAEEQQAGRGRSGRRWHSPPRSGVWLSVLVPGTPPGPHLPLLVGLAVSQAVEAVCPELRAGIEWPNDVLVDDRKVGGVLCEGGVGGEVVVGVGLNVWRSPERPPSDPSGRAAALEEVGCALSSRAPLAGALLGQLRVLCGRSLARIDGAELEELARRDVLRDRPVRTEQAGEGVARGIDPDGSLVLERPDGSRVPVVAGSVRLAGTVR